MLLSIRVHFYDSLYFYSNLTVIKTYRHYVKEIMGWTISVDVIQASTYNDIVMITTEGSVELVKSVQLHDRVFAARVSETKAEEEEEASFL